LTLLNFGCVSRSNPLNASVDIVVAGCHAQ
jgi:hypothetical protein